MNVKYDKEADAAYITFVDNVRSAQTYGDWPFHVDVDEAGAVIGIEVMDASRVMNETYLENNSFK